MTTGRSTMCSRTSPTPLTFDRNTLRNPRWNQRFPVGMVGYAFLESPGNPFDGIDNDGDADSTTIGQAAPVFDADQF